MATPTFAVGATVFFAHPEESWVVGTVVEVLTGLKGDRSYKCTARPSPSQPFQGEISALVHDEQIHAVVGDRNNEENVDDLLELTYLHDSTLLEQVRKRYFNSVIYTRIGPIVLALNPFDYFLPNYVDANMPKYMAEGDKVVASRSQLLPHAWSTAHLAYWLMRTFSKNQSIIVSGESGAGKTETAKIVVKYLGCVSTQQCSADDAQGAKAVTEKVNQTSPILEAFGNAKTVRNDNSSRFGKFMKVQFNKKGVMMGSLIEVYLLEKSRIVTHGPGERSYHSFYQLLRGATGAVRSQWKLEDPTRYKSCAIGQATVIQSVDDGEDYQAVCKAMDDVGMPSDEQTSVWKTVAGVLTGLRIDFTENDSGESSVKPSSQSDLENAANLWGVGAEDLSRELVTTLSSAGADKFTKKLTSAQAHDTKDALCKALYERLFIYLVERINSLIDRESATDHWVGLLDIFGFESFKLNSFEQVCINLANETLQNHYNTIIFTRDMEECREEGIDTESVVFYDNQPCLDLLSGKMSILTLLDEECALGKGTDLAFCEKILGTFKGHANIIAPKTEKGVFTIKHYAGEVKYTVDGFRDKNNDALKDALKLLLRTSTDHIIASLLPEPEDRRGKALTVSGLFRQQLAKLMATINSTHPHWIRCVKPHSAKQPRMFHGTEVMTQMRCAGVLETVRIRKMSYSMRFNFDEFWRMFRNIVSRQMPNNSTRDGARKILEATHLGPELAQVGKTKVFLKFDGYHEVTELLQHTNTKFVAAVQRFMRAKLACNKVHAHRLNRHVQVITALLRGHISDTLVKRADLEAKERYLLKTFRGLLMLQSQEDDARVKLVTAMDDSFRVISSLRRIDLDRVKAEWIAHLAMLHAKRSDEMIGRETDARHALVVQYEHESDTLTRLLRIGSDETQARSIVDREELAARAEVAVQVQANIQAIAADLADRAFRAFVAAAARLEVQETQQRGLLHASESTAFHYTAGLVAVQWDALCIGVPKIWYQEAQQRGTIMKMERESMEWNEKKWWSDKAAKDKRDAQTIEAREHRERILIRKDQEQEVIAILTAADRAVEVAIAAEYQRMQEEEAGRREAARQDQLRWQREEEARRAEQLRIERVKLRREQLEQQRIQQKALLEAEAVKQKLQRKLSEAEAFESLRRFDAVAGRNGPVSNPSRVRPDSRSAFGFSDAQPLTPRRYLHFSNNNPSAASVIHSPRGQSASTSRPRSPSPQPALAFGSPTTRGSPAVRAPSQDVRPPMAMSATSSSASMLSKLRSLAKPSKTALRPPRVSDFSTVGADYVATMLSPRNGNGAHTRGPLASPSYYDPSDAL